MNIGIVTQSFFPVRGGVSQHVFHTAQELQRRGHIVMIMTARFTAFDHEHDHGLTVRRLGINVSLPLNGTNVCVTFGRRLGQQLQALEKKYKFDVTQIHIPQEPFLPWAAMRNLQGPLVGTFHANTATGKNIILERFHNWWNPMINRLDGRTAVSDQARKFIDQYFPGEYRIIPNGVDTERFRPTNKPMPNIAELDGPKIIMIGRLTPRKGVKYIIQAMPKVIAKVPKARLIIVGGGFLGSRYKALVAPSIKDRVHFTGYASEAELPRYFVSGDICCFPTTGAESFGIVLIEAMASGKPIVASNIPGYDLVLEDNKEGVFVPPRNPAVLAEELVKLLNDKERRDRLSQAGLKKAATYSWVKVVDKLESYFEETIANKNR